MRTSDSNDNNNNNNNNNTIATTTTTNNKDTGQVRGTRTRDENDEGQGDAGQGRGTRAWTMRDNGQQGEMITRAKRMKMTTTRMMRTSRMRARGEDYKEDEDEGQQGG